MPQPRSPSTPSGPPRPRWLRLVLAGALLSALTILCMAAGVRWILPLRTQAPTGPHGVATRAWVWTDTSRVDPLRRDGGAPRRLPTRLYHPIDERFRARLPTDREIPDTAGPIVVLIHGALGTAHSHLSLAHQLASEGYLALAADHPGIALFARPGRSVVFPPPAVRGLLWETATMPASRRLSARARGPILPVLTADALFVHERGATVLRRDHDPVAFIGFGLGGLAAKGACAIDVSCITSITLDAPSDAQGASDKPTLAITSGSLTDTPELRAGSAHVALPLAGTLDLTDTPLQVRGSLLRSVVSSRHANYEGRDSQQVVRAIASSWLAHHLRGAPLQLEAAAAPWPEVRISR